MSTSIIDQRTANLGLPLPNVNNMQDQDCSRIAESLRMLDTAHGKARMDLAAVTEQSATAARDAATAIGKANDAASLAANAQGGGFYSDVPIDQVPADVLAQLKVGQFITAPVPAAPGGSAMGADLSAYVKKSEVRQWLTGDLHIHIDPTHANASDTPDAGRGLSADKPFKTLAAAVMQTMYGYAGTGSLIYLLHSDIEFGDNNIEVYVPDINMLVITSAGAPKTITAHKSLFVWGGMAALRGVNVTYTAAGEQGHPNAFLYASGYSHRAGFHIRDMKVNFTGSGQGLIFAEYNGTIAHIGDMELSGSYTYFVKSSMGAGAVFEYDNTITMKDNPSFEWSILEAVHGGIDTNFNHFTGAATGKIYRAWDSSHIITRGAFDTLSGTTAGVCDETSIAA